MLQFRLEIKSEWKKIWLASVEGVLHNVFGHRYLWHATCLHSTKPCRYTCHKMAMGCMVKAMGVTLSGHYDHVCICHIMALDTAIFCHYDHGCACIYSYYGHGHGCICSYYGHGHGCIWSLWSWMWLYLVILWPRPWLYLVMILLTIAPLRSVLTRNLQTNAKQILVWLTYNK